MSEKHESALRRFHAKTAKGDGCWIWQGVISRSGYGVIWNGHKNVRAHRFSFEHFNGQIPEGMSICHRCDTPACVNPEHLFAGTHSDNMGDAKKKGRLNTEPLIAAARLTANKLRGEHHPHALLNESDVIELRQLRKDGWALTALAKRFGVSLATAQGAARGTVWAHVPGALTERIYGRKHA